MRRFIIVATSWFGLGFFPVASGTVGTLGAIPLYLALVRLPLPLYVMATVALTIFACWVADRAAPIYGEHDSGKIVIDEVAGYLFTMTGVPPSWQGVLVGFVMFRLLDVTKPQPARWFDRSVQNGYGVVLDDVCAGVYACIATHIIMRFL